MNKDKDFSIIAPARWAGNPRKRSLFPGLHFIASGLLTVPAQWARLHGCKSSCRGSPNKRGLFPGLHFIASGLLTGSKRSLDEAPHGCCEANTLGVHDVQEAQTPKTLAVLMGWALSRAQDAAYSIDTCHPFHVKPATQSRAKLPPIFTVRHESLFLALLSFCNPCGVSSGAVEI